MSLSPDRDSPEWGRGRKFMAGLEMQTVYDILFMSSFEKKERVLGKFYLRLNEKINIGF